MIVVRIDDRRLTAPSRLDAQGISALVDVRAEALDSSLSRMRDHAERLAAKFIHESSQYLQTFIIAISTSLRWVTIR